MPEQRLYETNAITGEFQGIKSRRQENEIRTEGN
jgi:hypothetical protein